jgi:phage tail tape-measure protein
MGAATAGAAVMGGQGMGTAANAGKYAKYAKFGGVAGSLAMGALVLAPMVMGESDPNQTNEEKGEALGGVGGALAGAAAGAALGSVIPIIGTAVGGIVGGILGSFGGDYLGSSIGGEIGSWLDDDKDQLEAPSRDFMESGMGPGATFNSSVKIENLPSTVSAEEVAQIVVDKQKAQIMPAIRGPRGRIDLNLGGT